MSDTPNPEVTYDMLLTAGYTPEQTARMLRAVTPDIEAALLCLGRKRPEAPATHGSCDACGEWNGGYPDENSGHLDSCSWQSDVSAKRTAAKLTVAALLLVVDPEDE